MDLRSVIRAPYRAIVSAPHRAIASAPYRAVSTSAKSFFGFVFRVVDDSTPTERKYTESVNTSYETVNNSERIAARREALVAIVHLLALSIVGVAELVFFFPFAILDRLQRDSVCTNPKPFQILIDGSACLIVLLFQKALRIVVLTVGTPVSLLAPKPFFEMLHTAVKA